MLHCYAITVPAASKARVLIAHELCCLPTTQSQGPRSIILRFMSELPSTRVVDTLIEDLTCYCECCV